MKMSSRRLVILLASCIASAVLSILIIHQLILPLIILIVPTLESSCFEWAVYGAYRTQRYITFELYSPRPNILQWDDRCEQSLVLINPRGDSVQSPGPVILDSMGNLVWMSDEFGITTDLKIQHYQGQDYLTFWSGEVSRTYGEGVYYMLDATYQVAYTISAVGENLHGDLHEFKITEDGTALLTLYNVTQADLSSIGGPVHGWIAESIFQEVDIETGDLIFEWRASEHYQFNESYMSNGFTGYFYSIPYDYFHINSVDKDSEGNYLVSSRHMHTITCISQTGETIWILGGHRNEFRDLYEGKATDFSWQHHARWQPDGTLTLFDNGASDSWHQDASYSRGMVLHLDVVNRTVRLLKSYTSKQQLLTPSQGSLQILNESGNVFIGWGHAAAYSEFAADGELLCETHFGASLLDDFDYVASYRAFKANWIGQPISSPVAKISFDRLYVSWNGATEVVAWELQGSTGDDEFQVVDVVDKLGFEESFILPGDFDYLHYRVAALDFHGNVLGYSDMVENHADTLSSPLALSNDTSLGVGFAFFALVGVLLSMRYCIRRFHSTRSSRIRYQKIYEM